VPAPPGLTDLPALLAQANARSALNEMLPWLGALLLAALLGGALLFYLRHRLLGPDLPDSGKGLMEDLRAMRDRGEISEDEYEHARISMIAKATGRDAQQLRNEAIRKAGGRVAEPGFDLTGRPLPGTARPTGGGTDQGGPPDRGPTPHDPPGS
jgi:hypothetical protein